MRPRPTFVTQRQQRCQFVRQRDVVERRYGLHRRIDVLRIVRGAQLRRDIGARPFSGVARIEVLPKQARSVYFYLAERESERLRISEVIRPFRRRLAYKNGVRIALEAIGEVLSGGRRATPDDNEQLPSLVQRWTHDDVLDNGLRERVVPPPLLRMSKTTFSTSCASAKANARLKKSASVSPVSAFSANFR